MTQSKQPASSHPPVTELAGRITTIIESARNRVQSVVDHEMVRAYWEVGREIVEDEQKGEKRAEYGKAVIQNLSHELTHRHGKGFAASNLLTMRRFYLTFPIQHALRAELSWTHYRLLLKVEEQQKRSFYEIESAALNWSTYLPTEDELRNELIKDRKLIENNGNLPL